MCLWSWYITLSDRFYMERDLDFSTDEISAGVIRRPYPWEWGVRILWEWRRKYHRAQPIITTLMAP